MNKRISLGSMVKILITAGMLAFSIVLTVQMIFLARENQELKTDLAEINHIRYGLLNADEWRDRVTLILTKKIIEFDLTPENREELQKSLEIIMYGLLDDLEKVVEQRTSGQFSEMKKWIASMVFDVDQLRDSVPSYSSKVLDEINKPATKTGIQKYLTDKLGNLSSATYNLDSMNMLAAVIMKYDCQDKSSCRQWLGSEIEQKNEKINARVMLILIFVLLIFLINTITRHPLDRFHSALLLLSSAALLIGGITTPMIDLEARIDMLQLQLMGEGIIFRDNIIYFQTKSITDIVKILIREGSFEMIFVGILIFTFSIIFPLAKLISSFLYSLHLGELNENKVIRFFVIKSGKWSMADVMVVAIFMAYIGFNGVVSNQLESLSQSADPVEIFTTNGTRLLGGFYLFLSFCISSLALSEILTRKIKNKNSTNHEKNPQ